MKIGIIGLGLIGGTIAKSLNERHHISAYDINKKALDYSEKHHIIHKGYYDIKEFLENNNLIYLCLYPKEIKVFFEQNKDLIINDTVFIEISGVKTSIIKEVETLGSTKFDLVYTHPIAGREFSGVSHSDSRIFNKANYLIITYEKNKKENVVLAENLAYEMGFGKVTHVSSQFHDDIIAYTSQLTHVISMALVNSFDEENVDLVNFTGDSYRDLTRIANINMFLWHQLLTMNKEALLKRIEAFEVEFSKIKRALVGDDFIQMSVCLAKSEHLHKRYMKGNNK
ncbi:MAG: prephenate dehydrogenase/arogenate dehydrogenase family protein [Candidatus Izemoplasmatales bacterium]|nr:prephenate dehydrogenase/arogenate dehydrogenase family protein [Candidatus Izemoplasmatales bacterium]